MKFAVRLCALGAFWLLCLAAPASAQYMWLDSNADGVHTAADVMQANGTPTHVAVWLDPTHNRDGSSASCDTGDGDLTLENSYGVNFHAVNGTVSYSNFVNLMTTYTIGAAASGNVGFLVIGSDAEAAWATGSPATLAAIPVNFCTVDITGTGGAPSIEIADFINGFLNFTSFGTSCSGNDFDNTYKLAGPGGGSDWTDADGLGPAVGGNNIPVITAPATASGTEGVALATITATATDADAADVLTITQTGMPTDLTFTTSATVSPATATITGTPGFDDQGPHNIVWSVTDGKDTGTAPTALTIANVDRAPVVTAPATESGPENALLTFAVTASDPDGDGILSFTAAPLPTGATFTPNGSKTSGTFSWTPSFAQAGSYSVTFTATNALTGSATTAITITNVDQPPTIASIPDIDTAENTEASSPVSASDPDGDTINLTASLPAFATLDAPTSGAGSVTTTVTAHPTFTDAGTYPASVTATSNALSATAPFTINITNVDRPPVLGTISDLSVAQGSSGSTAVSASDPDGDTVNLTATLPAFAVLNPPTSGSGGVNTTVTASPTTGNAAGSYPSSVTATAGSLSDTKSFTIFVTSGDHPPVLAAISDINVNEGATASTAVSATDQDGDTITLTASLPGFATLNPPTSGAGAVSTTVSASPGFTDAGTYPASVTATALGLTSTQSFQIIVANVDRAPTLAAISDINVNEGATASTAVSATDPDGDTITLTASLPGFATLNAPTSGAGSVSTTVSASPGFSDAGTYPASVTATALALSDTKSFQIIVANVDRAPVLAAISNISVAQGSSASTPVSATDADGDVIALTASLPAFATLDAPTSGAGSVSTTVTASPSFSDASGSYPASVTATALALSDTKSFSINVGVTDRPPVLDPIPSITVDEGATGSSAVSATDPDGDTINLTASLPAFATLQAPTSGAGSVSTNVVATPGFSDAGTYPSSVTATSNALSDTQTFTITVNNIDRPVVLDPIGNQTVAEGATASAPVHAADPDGDAITLTASLPAFATLNAPTSGSGSVTTTITIAPGFSDAGSYPGNSVTATTSGSSATQSFDITVTNTDRAPVLAAISDVSVAEGATTSIPVSATDADNDVITLTASIPAFATLNAPTSGTGSVSTTITVSPLTGDAGTYPSSVTATANALSDTKSFTITVTGVNHDPIVTAPATETVNEGVLLTFGISATDQDGDHVTLTATGVPSGASFTDNNDNTGTFSWTPDFSQAGSYFVTFHGSDGKGGSGSATTAITVENVNRAPTADAGGPYNGVINVAVAFNGTGSSDPDGDTLAYAWTFGDGATATGATPSHAYTSTGTFNVTLTVTDTGGLTGSDATTATIVDVFAADAFFTGGNKTTRLASGKPYTCAQIEPVNNSFQISDVDLSSIVLKYGGSQISASGKTSPDSDTNGNGVQEISACFSKTDLRTLFAGLPAGDNMVTVVFEGNLVTGGKFQATTQMDVVSKGGGFLVSAAPNPLNPETEISYSVERAGRVRVQVFDLAGRLVSTLSDQARVAGTYSVRWDGSNRTGAHVASGVYFVRVQGADGSTVMPVTVLK